MAPEITTFCKLIKDMNGRADDDFMRAWLIVVVSCFMCPTTSLNVSPRCYPIVANLERVKRLNFCSFTAKQIRASLCGTMRKKAVTCCVHHMVVLYVDSLVVDIHVPDCPIRAEAWDSKRIGQVAKADRKPEGGYSKLSMKARFRSNRGDGLFAGYEQVEKFVSSKLPPTYNRNKKRKIAAMLSTLCSEISEKLGSFVEGIGKLDKNDAGSSRSYLHKTKRRKNVGDKETKAEESEHDGGIPEEDAEYLPSLGSSEDGGATSSDDNSDAFVVTRSSAQKQNNFREKPMASRDRENVNMKERTASEVEPGRECAKLEGHTNVTGKVNQGGHTHSLYGEQGQKTAYLQGERQNGHKIIVIEDNKLPGSGGNHITIHDVTPISSAPPIVHFVPQVAAQQTPSPANIVPDTVTSNKHKTSAWTARSPTPTVADKSTRGGEHGANYTPATTKSCPAPSNQKRKGTPTREQSTKAQATHGAMCMIREKLRLGPLAQQQAAQRAQAASPQMCSTPSIGNHHQQAETKGCPSFDLNRSFHKVEDTNRDLSTPLNPRNLDAYMAESEDDWGLDPEELQKVCFEAEAQFAKKKERERLETEERSENKGQINDKDARTPTTETAAAAAADVASSSRTPAAVGHERRVVRAPAQLRSPYIDPENADPFYCSKEVCDIYDAVCQFGNAAAPTTRRRTVQTGSRQNFIQFH